MLERVFNSPSNIILNRAMDAAQLRNKVIADNLANVETPGFKRNEVVFEEKLRTLLDKSNQNMKMTTTDSRHLLPAKSSFNLQPEIKSMNDSSIKNDNNNVDLDTENARLTKNKIYYDAMVQSMNSELRLLRMAITGRG